MVCNDIRLESAEGIVKQVLEARLVKHVGLSACDIGGGLHRVCNAIGRVCLDYIPHAAVLEGPHVGLEGVEVGHTCRLAVAAVAFGVEDGSNCRPIVVIRANLEETTEGSPGSLRVVSPGERR